jgi:hypothetical protein
MQAYLQTVSFGAVNTALTRKLQLYEPLFQIIPRLEAGFFVTALRFGLVATQKDMSVDRVNAKLVDGFDQIWLCCQRFSHVLGGIVPAEFSLIPMTMKK